MPNKLAIIFSSFVLTFILLSTSDAQSPDNLRFNPIRLVSDRLQDVLIFDCNSWRYAVETNSLRDWDVVPAQCVSYVENYMTGNPMPQYNLDLATIVTSVADHLSKTNKNENDVVIFDVSETLLSNIPYYERPDVDFGGKPFNRTNFNEWVNSGKAPAVPYMVSLYKALLKEPSYKIVIITGSSESFRGVLEANLEKVGYKSWFKFYLKDEAISTKDFKTKVRAQLVKDGYNIVANIGDQWRDLTGPNAGQHTFKVPNPMYYLG